MPLERLALVDVESADGSVPVIAPSGFMHPAVSEELVHAMTWERYVPEPFVQLNVTGEATLAPLPGLKSVGTLGGSVHDFPPMYVPGAVEPLFVHDDGKVERADWLAPEHTSFPQPYRPDDTAGELVPGNTPKCRCGLDVRRHEPELDVRS